MAYLFNEFCSRKVTLVVCIYFVQFISGELLRGMENFLSVGWRGFGSDVTAVELLSWEKWIICLQNCSEMEK
jgi:hypothetical protein